MDPHARRYEIRHTLGKGGFGTVYLANLVGAGGFAKPVALKMLHGQVDEVDEVAQRMRDEARMLGLLQHRAIVKVDGLVRLGGCWTIVMEYVEGVDLSRVVAAGGVPASVALEVLIEVAAALQSAFEDPGPDGQPLRALHRDIKPANIQITAKGEVKVLDFGIARAEFASREAETQNLMFGTPAYMAPERFENLDSHAADIYALGLVAFELLSGRSFGRAQLHPARHADAIGGALAHLSSLGLPADLCDLIGEMIAYEADHRPTARKVAQRARALLRQVPGPSLAEWAERKVPTLLADRSAAADDLSGRVLTEQGSASDTVDFGAARPWTDELPSMAATAGKVTLVGGGLLAGGVALVVGGGLGMALLVWALRAEPGAAPPQPATAHAAVEAPREAGTPPVAAPAAPASSDASVAPEPAPTPSAAVPSADAQPSSPAAPRVDASLAAPPALPAGPVAAADACSDLAPLEAPASAGKLSAPQLACLEAFALSGAAQVQRAKAGKVALVHHAAVCTSTRDCTGYERFQAAYFEEVERADADLLYAYALHLAKIEPRTDAHDAEAILWTSRALENRAQWSGPAFVQRVERLQQLQARAAYARWERAASAASPETEARRGEARTAIGAWADFLHQVGRDTSPATQLCASVVGTASQCTRTGATPTTPVVVSLASDPPGATVLVDGVEAGRTPLTVQLTPGSHQVSMRLPDGRESETRALRVGPREPTRHTWRADQAAWASGP